MVADALPGVCFDMLKNIYCTIILLCLYVVALQLGGMMDSTTLCLSFLVRMHNHSWNSICVALRRCAAMRYDALAYIFCVADTVVLTNKLLYSEGRGMTSATRIKKFFYRSPHGHCRCRPQSPPEISTRKWPKLP